LPESQIGVLIGVLIDYENVGLGSIHSLFDQLSDLGRMIVKRAYADWSKAPLRDRQQMLELGIEPKQYFGGSGKNAADICLAVDAVDLLHISPLDTFVIVSSDTDFVPLVSHLRAAGKTVIGAGHREVVSPALVHSCDRYISLGDGKITDRDTSAMKGQAESLLVRAMDASMEASLGDQAEVLAAKLHNTMLRMDPSFDFKGQGYTTFTQFLRAFPVVTIRPSRGRGDATIELVGGRRSRSNRAPSPAPVAGNIRNGESDPTTQATPLSDSDNEWESGIDAAWAKIPRVSIAGSKAASEAAKVLGISRLSASRYKSLQGLLNASDHLRSRWSREGNSITRRGV
jgi:uncharacterized protein (TIGR00288 family)